MVTLFRKKEVENINDGTNNGERVGEKVGEKVGERLTSNQQ